MPAEISNKIFCYLRISDLRNITNVSKYWKLFLKNHITYKELSSKLERSWKECMPAQNILQTKEVLHECGWHDNCCSIRRRCFPNRLVRNSNHVFVCESNNFLRVYDVRSSGLTDQKSVMIKEIAFPYAYTHFRFDVDKDVLAVAYFAKNVSSYSHADLCVKAFERKDLREIDMLDIRALKVELGRNMQKAHIKLFKKYLIIWYHSMPRKHVAHVDLYRKACKRTQEGTKLTFQHVKVISNSSYTDLQYLEEDVSHVLLRAQENIKVEEYDYLQLDEQFPASIDLSNQIQFCSHYEILNFDKDGSASVRKFAIHSRVQICAIKYPFIIYFFEDVYSIRTITVDGEIIFIEDTVLQVYDLKEKKIIKSFLVNNRNYIKSFQADPYHVILVIRNGERECLCSHKHEISMWIWSTKDFLDPSIKSQAHMEGLKRTIYFQVCQHNSEYNIFLSKDIRSLEAGKRVIFDTPLQSIHNWENCNEERITADSILDRTSSELYTAEEKNSTGALKSIRYFEFVSLTRNSLTVYISGCGNRYSKSQIVNFEFGF